MDTFESPNGGDIAIFELGMNARVAPVRGLQWRLGSNCPEAPDAALRDPQRTKASYDVTRGMDKFRHELACAVEHTVS
jgi:hypothetical protein